MTRATDARLRIEHLALIGNFLPRKCGIATYTTDTYDALQARASPSFRSMSMRWTIIPAATPIPRRSPRAIPQDDRVRLSRRRARDRGERRAGDLGPARIWHFRRRRRASYLLALLDRTTLPVIVTLHTVLEKPSADERRVMEALLRRAAQVIVMAEQGPRDPARASMAPTTATDRDDPARRARSRRWSIRHGSSRGSAGQGAKSMLTFGLLAPNKGIETMIAAMPAIVARHPRRALRRARRDPPQSGRARGRGLSRPAEGAGRREGRRATTSQFIDAFVEHDELLDYLQAADIYVTPYLNPAQITSGTLSYAVGVGKPVVSTPYVHATEILADGHGVLVDFGDSRRPLRARSTRC